MWVQEEVRPNERVLSGALLLAHLVPWLAYASRPFLGVRPLPLHAHKTCRRSMFVDVVKHCPCGMLCVVCYAGPSP